jgi:ABC-type transporter Mla subunit MlaD
VTLEDFINNGEIAIIDPDSISDLIAQLSEKAPIEHQEEVDAVLANLKRIADIYKDLTENLNRVSETLTVLTLATRNRMWALMGASFALGLLVVPALGAIRAALHW